MTIIVPAGYHNAVYRFRLDGDSDEMVFSLGVDNITADVPTVIAAGLFNAFTGTGMPGAPGNMITGWSMVGVTLYTAGLGGSIVTEHNEISTGTSSGSSLPTNCAILVQKRTALAGRRHRGRIFCPPFQSGEVNVDANGNHGGTLAELQGEWGAFYGALNGLDYGPVLFHSIEGLAPTPITLLVVDGKIATQRRRLR